jgi:allantoate deiminase
VFIRVHLWFQIDMPIDADRIQADIDVIAACTDTPGVGASRPTFSDAWRRARDHVAEQAEAAGCKVRIDACGNLHARPNAIAWDAPAWLSGSHIDSVPHGGNFDGVTGIVLPLEVLRVAKDDLKIAMPLELVIWAEEEGTTFGLGMLGSRAFVGELSASRLSELRNTSGQNYLEAGAPHGVRADTIGTTSEKIRPNAYIGLIECHIEQGPGLWIQDCAIAVVTAIAGRRQYKVTLKGQANHAGSTMMHDRRDALAGASEIVLAMERYGRDLGHRSVVTVGQINASPNAINVINEEVVLTIDFRSPQQEILARGDPKIRQFVESIANGRGLELSIDETEMQLVTEMDAAVVNKIQRVAKAHCPGGQIEQSTSGALHDAAILAPHVPTAMLFVASRDGISHNPGEFSRISDLALAGKVLFDAVRDRRLE